MTTILCSLSPARHEMLESDPEVLNDLLEARDEVPGLLDLGQTWDALDLLISQRGKDVVLGDAILARSGTKMKADAGFGNARLLKPDRVRVVAEALQKIPKDHIKKTYSQLSDLEMTGNFGQEPPGSAQEDEIGDLGEMLHKLKSLFLQAARDGKSMMMVIVEDKLS
jgi:hypothetical protein